MTRMVFRAMVSVAALATLPVTAAPPASASFPVVRTYGPVCNSGPSGKVCFSEAYDSGKDLWHVHVGADPNPGEWISLDHISAFLTHDTGFAAWCNAKYPDFKYGAYAHAVQGSRGNYGYTQMNWYFTTPTTREFRFAFVYGSAETGSHTDWLPGYFLHGISDESGCL